MSEWTKEKFLERFKTIVEPLGLNIISETVDPYDDDPLDVIPVFKVLVKMDDLSPEEIFNHMQKITKSINNELSKQGIQDIRSGYYSKEIGYDDILDGHAELHFDCLPFFIEPTMSNKF